MDSFCPSEFGILEDVWKECPAVFSAEVLGNLS
jgi:hypothetical protein